MKVELYGLSANAGTSTLAVGLAESLCAQVQAEPTSKKVHLRSLDYDGDQDLRSILGWPSKTSSDYGDCLILDIAENYSPSSEFEYSVTDIGHKYFHRFADYAGISSVQPVKRIGVVEASYVHLARVVRRFSSLHFLDHLIVVRRFENQALTATDVSSVLRCPTLLTISPDVSVARAIDAGLFTSRIPDYVHELRDSLIGETNDCSIN
jgi:hypothetical protein